MYQAYTYKLINFKKITKLNEFMQYCVIFVRDIWVSCLCDNEKRCLDLRLIDRIISFIVLLYLNKQNRIKI